jgi:type I restriction enzyme M protein
MASAADSGYLLAALKRLGGSAGNGRLREALGWPEDHYWAAQTTLLDAGALISGRGRGGSVSLPTAAATTQPDIWPPCRMARPPRKQPQAAPFPKAPQ